MSQEYYVAIQYESRTMRVYLNQIPMISYSTLNLFQTVIELIGIFSFAASGIIAALRKKMDWVGISLVAGLTAFGGGTLRDVLLDRRPFFWVENSYWLWVIIALTIIGSWVIKHKHILYTEKMIQVPDALGLSLATILGTQIALQFEMPLIVAILMGVVSATFGGVLRDMVCKEVPQLFSDHRPYALIAFLGSLIYILLSTHFLSESVSALISFLLILILRIVAIYKDWKLPSFNI
mgnify:FL=1